MKRLFVAAVVALAVGGCGSGGDVVSKTEYDQLSEGMSYSQAASIIGTPGEENASGTTEGVPGIMPSITTKMYSWQNSDGSNMNAMFQNDKMVNKAQMGLQ